ncbi:MAG: glycosyltransferase family 4 protein [Chloroflexi bacterium]|nr:glycosyltransferase family 4 protein [Chloroflexota bacterium]
MRVLIASKALVVGAYHDKLAALAAQPEIDDLVAVIPPTWREPGGRTLRLEPQPERGYRVRVAPIRFNGQFHLFYWPALRRLLAESRPDVVHVDEEPYNFATVHGVWLAHRLGLPSVFFTWQNLLRRYPPPFALFEQIVFRLSAHGIAGNAEAVQVLRAKGYRGPVSIIPQFGIDPTRFTPAALPAPTRSFTIGFVARLTEEKGTLVLLDALAGLGGDWHLHVIGSGPLAGTARARAAEARIDRRITWEPSVPSTDIPERMRSFDVLVLPSLSRLNWKEQFGRALIEAMACEVPIVGSDSGEIPNVVGDAGLIVPEGDCASLRQALATLRADPALRRELGRRGRARVCQRYTYGRVATDTVRVYREVVG